MNAFTKQQVNKTFYNFNSMVDRNNLKNRRSLVLGIIVLTVILGGAFLLTSTIAKGKGNNVQTKSEKVVVDKTYALPATDGKGNKKGNLNVTLKNVQKTNKISSNGKTIVARKGSSFVVLTFVIENSSNERVAFPTQNYVRFVDPKEKKFAPSISGKTIVVEPQATKIDTVGFTQPEDTKIMKFLIGELEGTKEAIEVKFVK